jgi:sterol desaturase/sphingolipid hydroxylase (fatty acid hydroxylase superfamily)
MTFLIPVHIGVLLLLLLVMTVTAVLNHSGWEILPERMIDGPVGGQLISATHHSLHHLRFGANFGLYFRLWDKLMGTDAMPAKTLDVIPAKAGIQQDRDALHQAGSPLSRG